MMECIYVMEARYVKDFTVYVKFNTGESGSADLKDFVYNYKQAHALRDPACFEKFYLDSWPILAWECGFDISPEALYFRVTGKKQPLPDGAEAVVS